MKACVFIAVFAVVFLPWQGCRKKNDCQGEVTQSEEAESRETKDLSPRWNKFPRSSNNIVLDFACVDDGKWVCRQAMAEIPSVEFIEWLAAKGRERMRGPRAEPFKITFCLPLELPLPLHHFLVACTLGQIDHLRYRFNGVSIYSDISVYYDELKNHIAKERKMYSSVEGYIAHMQSLIKVRSPPPQDISILDDDKNMAVKVIHDIHTVRDMLSALEKRIPTTIAFSFNGLEYSEAMFIVKDDVNSKEDVDH